MSFVILFTNTARLGLSMPLNLPIPPLTSDPASSSFMQYATRNSKKEKRSLHAVAQRCQRSTKANTNVPFLGPSSARCFKRSAGLGGSPGLGDLNAGPGCSIFSESRPSTISAMRRTPRLSDIACNGSAEISSNILKRAPRTCAAAENAPPGATPRALK